MIDFEQELYIRFGRVKDFTLGMRIAKSFYKLGEARMKRQMMKDAVEGEIAIVDYPNRYKFIDCEVPEEFNEGDKVIVQIRKK